jgi:enterobactin synthetase component D
MNPGMGNAHVLPPDDQVSFLDWPSAGPHPLQMAYVRFTPAEFDVGCFGLAGIDRPAQITASVLKRQAEFFHGRLCARAAMRLLGIEDRQVAIGPMREPIWPETTVGSISHAAGIAAAIALPRTAGYRGVGIDIETVFDSAKALAARAVVGCASELDCLADFEAALGRYLPLTLLFSAKESFFKAVHGVVGRYFNFDAIELESLDPAGRLMHLRVCETLSPEWRQGARCTIRYQALDVAHVATLCAW